MPGLLQLRANLAADISHVVSFREVKLDFELYYIISFSNVMNRSNWNKFETTNGMKCPYLYNIIQNLI